MTDNTKTSDQDKYLRCRNHINGEHVWFDDIAKNKDKPKQCAYCRQLETELIYQKKKWDELKHEDVQNEGKE